MKLIVNADDFAMTISVSNGIIKSMKEGIVTDTTAMVNMPAFEESMSLALASGINEMGIHLNITCGKPLLPANEVKSIVDNNGLFYRGAKKIPQNFDINEIEKELRAQINKFISTGVKLNHMDGHHHFFVHNDAIYNLVLSLAKEYKVPLRFVDASFKEKTNSEGVKTKDHCHLEFFAMEANLENLIELLEKYKDKPASLEIMCHPAIVDEELIKATSYAENRGNELEILTSDRIKNYIKKSNIELINYSGI